MTYKIYEDPERSLFTVSFGGLVDDAELLRLMDELYRLPNFANFDQFIDFSRIKRYAVTPNGMANYNAISKDRPERAVAKKNRKIVVYAPDDLAFGMTRLLATVASNSGVDIEVFRDLPKALDFIGLDRLPAQSEKNG
tara:strand:- start:20523 stop:20936 length:414 start_codon:yes stop_codon:yes gene_type:complete